MLSSPGCLALGLKLRPLQPANHPVLGGLKMSSAIFAPRSTSRCRLTPSHHYRSSPVDLFKGKGQEKREEMGLNKTGQKWKARKTKPARRKASHPLLPAFHGSMEKKEALRATLQSSALTLSTVVNVPCICSVNSYQNGEKLGLPLMNRSQLLIP